SLTPLIVVTALAAPAAASPWWVSPIDEVTLHASAFHETERTYSTDLRPRDITGELALSCEHTHGRPCGHGLVTYATVDSAAGYGDDAITRVRLLPHTGTGEQLHDSGIDLDRAYVAARYDLLGFEIGRDAFVLGPPSHTQVGWGDNAPPLDHV